jgi:S1-C subfamily serine protease
MLLAALIALIFAKDLHGSPQDEPTSASPRPVPNPSASAAPTGRGARTDATSVSRKRVRDATVEIDDWTFRPTVLVRRGTSQGSGTIVASVEGETLVLTAAHVIRGHGPIYLELHRYNLGIEHLPPTPGRWPRQVVVEQAASDVAADVAILRVRDMIALPYVAQLGSADDDRPTNDQLTSVGIDLGAKLSSWDTRLVEVIWFELNESGSERPFLATARIPEHGRSGGGLFDSKGRLVGVCVGHAEVMKGKRMGVFSSVENVQELLRKHDLTSIVDRSVARQERLARNSGPQIRHPGRFARSNIIPTEASDDLADPSHKPSRP